MLYPGNPGLLDFYTPFLNAIYLKDTTSRLAIFGHSHIGHSPGFHGSSSSYSLACQVQSALEAFDAIKASFGAHTKVVIIGHSVGAWVSLQVVA